MTKKEVVNAVRNYVINTIKGQGLDVVEIDQKDLIEDIEREIEDLISLYSIGLDEAETANELED